MKVILLESVPKVGSVNEIVEVSDGFAMNSLIPQGLASIANEKNIANIEKQVKENKQKDETRKKELKTIILSLNGEILTISASANDKGTLFSALSEHDLMNHIKSEKNLEIESSYIELDQPIKEIGTHFVKVSIDDVESKLTVEVISAE